MIEIQYFGEKIYPKSRGVFHEFAEYVQWLLDNESVCLIAPCTATVLTLINGRKGVGFKLITWGVSRTLIGLKVRPFGHGVQQVIRVICRDPEKLRDEMIEHFGLALRP